MNHDIVIVVLRNKILDRLGIMFSEDLAVINWFSNVIRTNY